MLSYSYVYCCMRPDVHTVPRSIHPNVAPAESPSHVHAHTTYHPQQHPTMAKGGGVSLFTLALLGVLLSLVPFLVEHSFRKEYPVHDTGVMIVTGASTGIGNHAVKYLAERHPSVVVYAGVRKDADFEAIKAVGLANLRSVRVRGWGKIDGSAGR